MRPACLILALFVLAGCDSTDPSGVDLTGTFAGSYTAATDPGEVFEGVLQLTHRGSQVTGTLTTNTGRSGTVSGSVSGTRLTATLRFTDPCGGTATTTADIADDGNRLVGNYQATDCLGQYAGGYDLRRQR